MSDYYDRQGNPLTMEEWSGMLGRREQQRVAETQVGQIYVSTVWLGLNHNWGQGPPLIFETMAFGPRSWSELLADRYSTEAEALAGHQRAVEVARRRHHGWVKHTRDERRAATKRYLALLETDDGDLGEGDLGEMQASLLALERIIRRSPRE